MLQQLRFGPEDLVIDVYASFLYHRLLERPAVNDQFDIQYPFYLKPDDRIWTRDQLIPVLLRDHLARPELLFEP